MDSIILEGSDFTGKSTLAETLGELELPVKDRSQHISPFIQLGDNIEDTIGSAAESLEKNHANDLVVILVAKDEEILAGRRDKHGAKDDYDAHAEAYNRIYSGLADRLTARGATNVVVLPIDTMTVPDVARQVIEPWVSSLIPSIDFDNPTVEGHSKRIYSLGSVAVTELKPSLFSITHGRYDTNVTGTDELRLRFWELFGHRLNQRMARQVMGELDESGLQTLIDKEVLKPSYPFISNYLGSVAVGDKDLVIARFDNCLPPIEVVWKRYLVGTMKHRLLGVDQYPMRDGQYLSYEGEFPNDFVRFDWRNPVPDDQISGNRQRPIEDEAIPEGFADLYINVDNAKQLALAASHEINAFLEQAGYRFVDTCYFMNADGSLIYSEITPDGMRVKQKTGEGSFDKDLWRQGKDADTLRAVWGKLLGDLREVA